MNSFFVTVKFSSTAVIILLIKYMAYGLWSSCWPKTPPMVVSKSSIEIRKGKDQLGPRRMGVVDTFCFNVSQASLRESNHSNYLFLDMSINKGLAIFEKIGQFFYSNLNIQ